MPNKTPAVISVILTILLLVVFAIVSVLFEMLALNGASERQGMTAMGISLLCQGVGAVLLGFFAWWLTNLLISKFNWNKIIAVVVTVFLGTTIGTGISFLSLIISIPIAGIR
jgi:hypothetical protein